MNAFQKYLDIKLARTLNKTPKGPALIHIEITKECNFRCKMCDIWWQDHKGELEISEFRKLADEFEEMGVKAVALTGGEPTLVKNIEEIIRMFKRKGMIVHTNTNGSDPRTAERLKDTGIDSVTVSIDFYGEEHDKNRGIKDCFKRAVQTLKELKEAGIKRVGIGTLIMGQNTGHLEKLTQLAKELGIFISFAGFDLGLIHIQHEQRKKNFQKFVEGVRKVRELRKKYDNIIVIPEYLDYMESQSVSPKIVDWCYAGYATCIIRAKGDVQACYTHKSAGNLRNNTFTEIWNSKEMNDVRTNYVRKCSGCFANCTIEPSLVFSNLNAALQFYMLKWSKVKA